MATSCNGGFKGDLTSSKMPVDVVTISGYLQKKTRDGRWQKRWFETNGCFLTYYKSKRMTKLLAALDLVQVGSIKLVDKPEPGDEGDVGLLFSIELNERVYILKAADKNEAQKWVEVLNQLKAGGSPDGESIRNNSSQTKPGSSMGIEKVPDASWKKESALCKCCIVS